MRHSSAFLSKSFGSIEIVAIAGVGQPSGLGTRALASHVIHSGPRPFIPLALANHSQIDSINYFIIAFIPRKRGWFLSGDRTNRSHSSPGSPT